MASPSRTYANLLNDKEQSKNCKGFEQSKRKTLPWPGRVREVDTAWHKGRFRGKCHAAQFNKIYNKEGGIGGFPSPVVNNVVLQYF
ncbi:hypothetical protein AM500_14270 [Bacillus sp. FJAT-18017]|nr:hypothetical protein AM500_14270 [Bacillus sp. FJAT-18017]